MRKPLVNGWCEIFEGYYSHRDGMRIRVLPCYRYAEDRFIGYEAILFDANSKPRKRVLKRFPESGRSILGKELSDKLQEFLMDFFQRNPAPNPALI